MSVVQLGHLAYELELVYDQLLTVLQVLGIVLEAQPQRSGLVVVEPDLHIPVYLLLLELALLLSFLDGLKDCLLFLDEGALAGDDCGALGH